jgi:hypothetical protein
LLAESTRRNAAGRRGPRKKGSFVVLSKRTTWIPVVLLTAASAAVAADRHVFLDTNGNGQLNDCPNPAHNAKGVAGNTDELSYCLGGSQDGKIVGTVAGTTTSSSCSSGGGAVSQVRNGVQADVDRDGAKEFVYGHPQACVWNMAKSDSCEVHAGTYKKAGAQCDGSCGDQNGVDAQGNGSALEGTIGTCDKFDCFLGSVVAFGDGPNMDGTGYGTSTAPGYLRGAQMNGSTDSWDPNGDKNPADGLYPAVLSGDANGNGSFDITACSGSSCTGDAFYGVIIGCGGGTFGQYFCRTSPLGSSGYVKIDSNADGTFDQNVGVFSLSSKEVHYLQIKDLEFTRYNGGNGAYFAGTRPKTATIDLNGGDGSTNFGVAVDHIYLHDNDFTYGIDNYWDDNVSNEGYTENHWAAFNDQSNYGCAVPTQIQNSFLVQNNARLFNFDGDEDNPCGCETYIHDNRILVDVDPAKAGVLYRNNVEGGPVPGTGSFTRTHSVVLGYYKSIGNNPAQHRLWNNEIVIKSMGTSRGYFMDLQGIGAAHGGTNGALWMYGNLFRYDPSVTLGFSRFWQGYCGDNSTNYRWYLFNNTFDMNTPMEPICSDNTGSLIVEKNNAFLRTTNTNASSATTKWYENNLSSTASSDRAVWFNPGAFAAGSPSIHGGLANYKPRVGGPLDGAGNCDPDRDGVRGVDWNGDGTQETSWRDLAGNLVDCSAGTATIAIGAIQRSATTAVCGNGVRESGETCDGLDLGGSTCVSLGFGGGTLRCSAVCAWDTSSCTAVNNPPSNVQGLRRTDRH